MNAMVMGQLRDKGPCEVWYGTLTLEVLLGPYFGSVIMRTSSTSSDVMESSHGTTPVDTVVTGYGPTEVTVPFTRMSLANLAIVIPGATTSGSGLKAIAHLEVGRSEYDNSKSLILKPIVDGVESADQSEWLQFDHAYPNVDMEEVYDEEGQRVFNVIFKCFPDASTGVVYHTG